MMIYNQTVLHLLDMFVYIAIWPVTSLVFFNTNRLVGITVEFCEVFSYTVGKSWGECVLVYRGYSMELTGIGNRRFHHLCANFRLKRGALDTNSVAGTLRPFKYVNGTTQSTLHITVT